MRKLIFQFFMLILFFGVTITGLGLAIVKHIVILICGRIQIYSEIGDGTIFTIFLPKS